MKKFCRFSTFRSPGNCHFYGYSQIILAHCYRCVLFFPSQAVFRFFAGQISIFSFFSPVFAPFSPLYCAHAIMRVYLRVQKRGLSGPFSNHLQHPVVRPPGLHQICSVHFLLQRLVFAVKAVDLFLQGVVAPGRLRGGLRVLPGLRIGQLRLQGGGVRLRL